MQPPDVPTTFRFGDFELDVAGYSLRRGGQQVRIERRPMDLLILLVQRRRELVSRNDIVERLWGPDVVVDVDMGVNTAIRKIRQVLGDAPETPAFVETVSGKGYRFIAEVEAVQPAAAPSASRASRWPYCRSKILAEHQSTTTSPTASPKRRRRPWDRLTLSTSA